MFDDPLEQLAYSRAKIDNILLETIIREGGMPAKLSKCMLPYRVRTKKEHDIFEMLHMIVERDCEYFVRTITSIDNAFEFSFAEQTDAVVFKLYFG